MKQLSLFIFSFIISAGSVFSQMNLEFMNRNLKEKERLHFKSKSVRNYIEYVYKYSGDSESKQIQNFRIVKFDTLGRKVYSVTYDKNKHIESYDFHKYNNKNLEKMYYEFDKTDLLYKTAYYYDLDDELIEEIKKTKFGSVHSTTTNYYKSRHLSEHAETLGPSGKLIASRKTIYNSNQYPTSVKYDLDSKPIYDYSFKYNDDILSEERFSDHKEEINLVHKFNYKGDLIDEIEEEINKEKFLLKRLYKYFGDDTTEFERSFILPDLSKYKKSENRVSHYEFKTPPNFPGGKEALIKYIEDNLKYPKKALKAGIQGLVIVSFVIDKNGTIGNIRVNKAIEFELDNAAIDLVKKMPKWKPALNSNGKETMSSFVLPVNFVIKK